MISTFIKPAKKTKRSEQLIKRRRSADREKAGNAVRTSSSQAINPKPL